MRTKALLGAAIMAAGLAAASAQVYSLNVVGYVNVVIPTGYSMLNNPLDAGGNNTVEVLFGPGQFGAGPMDNNTVFTWNGSAFVSTFLDAFGDWTDPNVQLPPGRGFMVQNGNAAFTNTFVGTVLQGTLNNTNVSNVGPQYSLLGNMVPKAGYLGDPAGLNWANMVNTGPFTSPAGGDTAFLWNGTAFVSFYNDNFAGWPTTTSGGNSFGAFTVDPTGVNGPGVHIGEAFFYQNGSAAAAPWTQSFTVQ